MKSKIFLAFLLFTPPLVLLISTLSFQSGFSPINTKNNGVFFSEYFDVKDLNLINDKKVNIPSYEIKVGDKISWREKSKKSPLFEIATANTKNNDSAKWLSLNKTELSVQINNLPSASDAELEIDTRQIVEYYSRR